MDKSTLIDTIRRSQAAMEQAIAPLSEQQVTNPGVTGEWSIKDILAHIVTWERVLLDRLRAAASDTTPTFASFPDGPQFAELTEADIDRINDQFYRQNKDRTTRDVLTEFKAISPQIVEIVQMLPEDDLLNPQRFAWAKGQPLWEYVSGDTYEHIDEHLDSIQTWIRNV